MTLAHAPRSGKMRGLQKTASAQQLSPKTEALSTFPRAASRLPKNRATFPLCSTCRAPGRGSEDIPQAGCRGFCRRGTPPHPESDGAGGRAARRLPGFGPRAWGGRGARGAGMRRAPRSPSQQPRRLLRGRGPWGWGWNVTQVVCGLAAGRRLEGEFPRRQR